MSGAGDFGRANPAADRDQGKILDQSISGTCPKCHTPVKGESLVSWFAFPDDTEHVVSVLEQRINVVECPVCRFASRFDVPVTVVNAAERCAVVMAHADVRASIEEALGNFPQGFEVRSLDTHQQLYDQVASWATQLVWSDVERVISGDLFKLPRVEQIACFTPLLLRTLKGMGDGHIPIAISPEATADAETHRRYMAELFVTIMGIHLGNLRDEAIDSGTLPQLEELVGNHVPTACLTPPVLEELCARAMAHPVDSPAAFGVALPHEVLNAVAHARAGIRNPRRAEWAEFTRMIWILEQERDGGAEIDSQVFISRETIHRTVEFGLLWNAVAPAINRKVLAQEKRAILDDIARMMEAYDFGEEYIAAMKAGPIRMIPAADADVAREQRHQMLRHARELLLENRPLNRSTDDSIALGILVAGQVQLLIVNGERELAYRLANEMLDVATGAGDYTAAFAIGAHSVEPIMRAEEYSRAGDLLLRVLPLWTDPVAQKGVVAAGPALGARLFTELGNLHRYLHRYKSALKMYDIASDLSAMAHADAEPAPEGADDTLQRNRAIVLGEMGQLAKASGIFEELLTRDPDDPNLHHSIGLLHFRTNNFERALYHLDRTASIAHGQLLVGLYGEALIALAMVQHARGEQALGVQALVTAFHALPADAVPTRLRVAAAAMRFRATDEAGATFVGQCVDLLRQTVTDGAQRSHPERLGTIIHALGERMLDEGATEEAVRLLEPELRWFDDNEIGLPWQIGHLRARLALASGELSASWRHLDAALRSVDAKVPQGEDAGFSSGWMRDKNRFQETLAATAVELVDRGIIAPDELLRVYEFLNGREISARVGAPTMTVEAIATLAQSAERAVSIFCFLDAGDEIRLLHVSATGEPPALLDNIRLRRADVLAVRKQTADAFNWDASDLEFLDQQLSSWRDLNARLGAAIAPHVGAETHVCFLPGRALTGLPLHLAEMPTGGTLLDRAMVSYAPNFATLLALGSRQRGDSENAVPTLTVVTVTKQQETKDFRDRALGVGPALVAAGREKGLNATFLNELDASHDAVLRALADSDELAFVCHGAYVDPHRGYGICVSDGELLPPASLRIEKAPELARFVITWDDIDALECAAERVVSVACSSGLVEVTAGGVRSGLEQTLFAKGTRTIIAPLWNVDQQSSLEWLQLLYEERFAGCSLETAYRRACLRLKEKYQHPYFWGAFALNGALTAEEIRS